MLFLRKYKKHTNIKHILNFNLFLTISGQCDQVSRLARMLLQLYQSAQRIIRCLLCSCVCCPCPLALFSHFHWCSKAQRMDVADLQTLYPDKMSCFCDSAQTRIEFFRIVHLDLHLQRCAWTFGPENGQVYKIAKTLLLFICWIKSQKFAPQKQINQLYLLRETL